jgi:putative SOS response-associated peptidase YedK
MGLARYTRSAAAMCARFTQRYTWREIHDLYDLTGAARNLQAHDNIAPTDTVDVVKFANGTGADLSAAGGRPAVDGRSMTSEIDPIPTFRHSVII